MYSRGQSSEEGALGGPGTSSDPGEDEKGLHSPAPGAFLGEKGPRLQKVFFFMLSPRRRPSGMPPCPQTSGSQLRPGKQEHRGFQCLRLLASVSPAAARSPCVYSRSVCKYNNKASAHDRAEHVKAFKKCANFIWDFLGTPECPCSGKKNGKNWRCRGWQDSRIKNP